MKINEENVKKIISREIREIREISRISRIYVRITRKAIKVEGGKSQTV